MAEHTPSFAVVIDYTNHRGERRERTIMPSRILFDATPWHPEPEWLLTAWDYEKKDHRDFAMKDIHSWRPAVASAPPSEADARKAFVAEVTAHMRPEPLDIIDDRTPEQLRADGDDRWPDGTPYTPSLAHAAPDLLAACEALLSYLDGPAPDEPPYGAIVQARAAIKQAKGETP